MDETGGSEVQLNLASLPISFDWLPDGTVIVVNATAKKLQKLNSGALEDFVDLGGAEHRYNEIVVDGAGRIYLNNVNFEFPGGDFRPGFIALVHPDGSVVRQVGDLAFPNGMVVTPDGGTLICAESFNGRLTAFDIASDGALSNPRLWAQLEGQGGDGMCMDAEGAIWIAAGARCVRVAEGGRVLDEVPLDRMAFACMLGGHDGRTLYICANEWTGSVDVCCSYRQAIFHNSQRSSRRLSALSLGPKTFEHRHRRWVDESRHAKVAENGTVLSFLPRHGSCIFRPDQGNQT